MRRVAPHSGTHVLDFLVDDPDTAAIETEDNGPEDSYAFLNSAPHTTAGKIVTAFAMIIGLVLFVTIFLMGR